MANKPVKGSYQIAGVEPDLNVNGEMVPCRIVVDTVYDPPRLIVELPDRALRNLGVVSIAAGSFVIGNVNTGLSGIYTEAFDNTGGNSGTSVLYHGWAAPGTSKATAGWAIVKFSFDAGTDTVSDIQWAGGAATFATSWNNRAAASYS